MSEIGNNYEQIRLKFGDEVAKSLDKVDDKEDKNISQENLSIFYIALEVLEENQPTNKKKFLSKLINPDKLPHWAVKVATQALNYIESLKLQEQNQEKKQIEENLHK